jgi:MFS family permease
LRIAARELARNKSFILLILAFSAQVFAYNPVEFWVPTLLQREKAIPMLQANTIFGVAVLLGGFLGPLTGGFIADFLAKRWRYAYFWVSATSALGLVVPLLTIASAARGNFLSSGIFVAVVFGNMSVALVMAILVGAVMPGLRATATAILLIACHLLGDAISQPLIGRVSTSLQSSPGALMFLRHFGEIVHIPQQHYLSLAFAAVTLPAAIISTVLFIVAIPRANLPRSAPV